ncbi:GNAT family N-acetyltransferase [Minwuia sp.]|uniref:GNAT family N-acetyltransferase n=1 Tax=Minwuia sp. TaxID=2493630 RepID=UPI003A93DE22
MTEPAPDSLDPILRPWTAADARACLRVFRRAVSVGAAHAYSVPQRHAWSRIPYSFDRWRQRQARNLTLVCATCDGTLAGFTEYRADGHVHMLHVDPAFTRRGIGMALLRAGDAILTARGVHHRSTWASHVSKPVFARAGFTATGYRLAPAADQRLLTWRMVRRGGVSCESIR